MDFDSNLAEGNDDHDDNGNSQKTVMHESTIITSPFTTTHAYTCEYYMLDELQLKSNVQYCAATRLVHIGKKQSLFIHGVAKIATTKYGQLMLPSPLLFVASLVKALFINCAWVSPINFRFSSPHRSANAM